MEEATISTKQEDNSLPTPPTNGNILQELVQNINMSFSNIFTFGSREGGGSAPVPKKNIPES